MKKLALIVGLILSISSYGTNHIIYNEQQLRATNIQPGDVVDLVGSYFRLTSTYSGVNNVTYRSANGKTKLSGLVDATQWIDRGNNIYSTYINTDEVNIVVLNGNIQQMGRYPNAGYITYPYHLENWDIFGFSIPKDFTGGEVVIRKKRYILDRHKIDYQSFNGFQYLTGGTHGNNTNYEPENGNGWFVQDHINTLDQNGEWFFDKKTHELFMYFSGNPSQQSIRVATPHLLVDVSNKINITFQGIEFEGADTLIKVGGSTSIFQYDGGLQYAVVGLAGAYSDNIKMLNSHIFDCTSMGFYIEERGNNTTIRYCEVDRIGLWAGMGNSGDGTYSAISVAGDNTYIEYNSIKNVGFNAINYNGNTIFIRRNLIDRFDLVKDDGGAIYTFSKANVQYSNRFVTDNIILNGVGAAEGGLGSDGTTGMAACIYLDGKANHVNILNNTCAHGDWVAILSLSNSHNIIDGNVSYDYGLGVAIEEKNDSDSGKVRDLEMQHNIFIAKEPKQLCIQVNQWFGVEPFTNWEKFPTSFGYNNYIKPIGGNTVALWYAPNTFYKEMGVEEWKTYGVDVGTQSPDVHITNTNQFMFEYNWSSTPKPVYLDGLYQGMWGEYYSGQITVSPYSCMVIVKVN